MSEKYGTDELVGRINQWMDELGVLELEDKAVRDAIVTRLRAGDGLCKAANGLLDFIKAKFPKDFVDGGVGFTCPHHKALRTRSIIAYVGNDYQVYEDAVYAIGEKYCGRAEWGVLQKAIAEYEEKEKK